MQIHLIRQFVNKYGTIVVASAFGLALILYLLTRSANPGFHAVQAYYVDEETGDESIHALTEIPPLLGRNGRLTVVQAFKFKCEKDRRPFVGYYRKYDDAARAKIAEVRGVEDSQRNDELEEYLTKGELVRLPAVGSPWVVAGSEEGEKVRQVTACKDGHPAIPVVP